VWTPLFSFHLLPFFSPYPSARSSGLLLVFFLPARGPAHEGRRIVRGEPENGGSYFPLSPSVQYDAAGLGAPFSLLSLVFTVALGEGGGLEEGGMGSFFFGSPPLFFFFLFFFCHPSWAENKAVFSLFPSAIPVKGIGREEKERRPTFLLFSPVARGDFDP